MALQLRAEGSSGASTEGEKVAGGWVTRQHLLRSQGMGGIVTYQCRQQKSDLQEGRLGIPTEAETRNPIESSVGTQCSLCREP